MGLSVCLSVDLSVCLSARISPESQVRSLPNFLCMLLVSVARSPSTMFTTGRIAYRREGVFFPTDNAYISGTTRAIFAKFLCMLPTYVARSSDMFSIGRIAYRREGVFFPTENALSAGKRGWECTAREKYAIYNCLVLSFALPLQNIHPALLQIQTSKHTGTFNFNAIA